MNVDICILGGEVADGVHDTTSIADVLVKDGRILSVGQNVGARVDTADLTIDATGLVVMPGFVDTHVHLDALLLDDLSHTPTLMQGITTVVVGQDGTSFFPASATIAAELGTYFAPINGDPGQPVRWTVASFLKRVDRRSNLNVAALVPHGNVRASLAGTDRPLTPPELAQLTRLLTTSFAEGAVGVSTGLHYTPSRYANAAELDAIGMAAAAAGRPHVTHMRGYGHEAFAALGEVADSAERTKAHLHVSHLMAPAGILDEVDRRLAAGVAITFDSYPYTFGFSILSILALPGWAQDGGREAVLRRLADTSAAGDLPRWWASEAERLSGLRLAYAGPGRALDPASTLGEMASTRRIDVGEVVRRTLLDSGLQATALAPNGLTDEDLRALAAHPAHMGGSDGIYIGQRPHPRGWGAFARFLTQQVLETDEWSWATAAHHLAALPARTFGLKQRGALRPGWHADVTIVDPSALTDRATLLRPTDEASGVRHLIVNGVPALLDGRATGERPGRAVRWAAD